MKTKLLIALALLINTPKLNASKAFLEKESKEVFLNKFSNHLAGIDGENATHNRLMDELWNDYYQTNLSKLIEWQNDNIENLYKKDCHVFYPFSGPDIVHMLTFFPNCSKYTMVGLEAIGDIDNQNIDEVNLESLRVGLYSLLKKSFFVTREMWSDFKLNNKGITLPLLALSKRLGYEIIDINSVSLTPSGEVIKVLHGHNNGAKLTLQKDGKTKEIYYFRQSLKNDNKIITYLKKYQPDTTYLKAAQYTLFSPEFASLKNSILSMSQMVLQDDSGIPFRYFSKDKWSTHLYGKYIGPYGKEFRGYIQPGLVKLYENEAPNTLPFNLGYGYKKTTSCLMVFKKQS